MADAAAAAGDVSIDLDPSVEVNISETRGSDSEECDDPGDTLMVPEADSEIVNTLEKSPSPREDTDSGIAITYCRLDIIPNKALCFSILF